MLHAFLFTMWERLGNQEIVIIFLKITLDIFFHFTLSHCNKTESRLGNFLCFFGFLLYFLLLLRIFFLCSSSSGSLDDLPFHLCSFCSLPSLPLHFVTLHTFLKEFFCVLKILLNHLCPMQLLQEFKHLFGGVFTTNSDITVCSVFQNWGIISTLCFLHAKSENILGCLAKYW